MKINRRTMLQFSGGVALGLVLPESRKIVAYIVTADSLPFYLERRRVINRAWHVYWAKHPDIKERLSPQRYKWDKNVKIEAFYDTKDFPKPALEPLKLHCPKKLKKLTDYDEYHCFRTYDIDCAGRINVICDKDGNII